MSDPITLHYLWNRSNVQHLFDATYRYEFAHSARRYIGWFFIALLQFGVVGALLKGSVGLLLFSTLVLLYWYAGKKWIARRRAMRSFESSPFRDKEIQIEVTDDGLAIQGEAEPTHWPWASLDGVMPLGDDLLIHKAPYAHYIPAAAFTSLEEKSRFKTMARKYGKLLKE